MMDVSEKFHDVTDNRFDDDDDDDVESGNFSDAFICCVCRDLLYKPVVLACGHISCFWCIHKSMNGLYKSSCPICRNQYFHFPYICEKLHLLLLKLYPKTYKIRENQTLEEERKMGCFSPQMIGPVHPSQPEEPNTKPSDESLPCFLEADPSSHPHVLGTGETLVTKEHVGFASVHRETGLAALLDQRKDTAGSNATLAEDRNSNLAQINGPCKVVSADVLCDSCKLILFRPIVLNCGHAFCFCCIVIQKDEVLTCQACESPHPGDIPKVCLEFDHFLEEQFPEEYGQRKGTVHMEQEQSYKEALSTYSSAAAKKGLDISHSLEEGPLLWWTANSRVHIGVGCDSCGMYPIIGDRYRCKDCSEEIGYDLCKDCYTTSSKLPGRFNQQHTSEHQFEIVTSNEMQEAMLRLIREQLHEVPAVLNGFESENTPSNVTNEDTENVVDAPSPPPETDTNQSEN